MALLCGENSKADTLVSSGSAVIWVALDEHIKSGLAQSKRKQEFLCEKRGLLSLFLLCISFLWNFVLFEKVVALLLLLLFFHMNEGSFENA